MPVPQGGAKKLLARPQARRLAVCPVLAPARICLPYMSALYVCLICRRLGVSQYVQCSHLRACVHAHGDADVGLICLPYMSVSYVCFTCRSSRRGRGRHQPSVSSDMSALPVAELSLPLNSSSSRGCGRHQPSGSGRRCRGRRRGRCCRALRGSSTPARDCLVYVCMQVGYKYM